MVAMMLESSCSGVVTLWDLAKKSIAKSSVALTVARKSVLQVQVEGESGAEDTETEDTDDDDDASRLSSGTFS